LNNPVYNGNNYDPRHRNDNILYFKYIYINN